MAQGEFLWCDLATFEVEDVLPVYAALFDWTYRSETFAHGAIYHYASNDRDVTAGIYEMPAEYRKDGMQSFWMSYVGIDNIVDGIDTVVAEGGRVILGPASFGVGASIAMIADPDGAILTLFSGSHLQHRPQPMFHGRHFWNELFARNVDRACHFYDRVFGWKFEEVDGGMHVRNMAGAPTACIQPIHKDTPSGAKPHWAVSFAADDLVTLKSRCEAHNLATRTSTGIDGRERLCVTDRNGASFYAVTTDARRVSWFA